MSNSDQMNSLLSENTDEDFLNFNLRTPVLQFSDSLQSDSNATSHILYNDIWQVNKDLLSPSNIENVLISVENIMKTIDTSKVQTWKSNLNEVSQSTSFNFTCDQCENHTHRSIGIDSLLNNECKCNFKSTNYNSLSYNTKTKVNSFQNVNCGEESKVFKPKFGCQKFKKNSTNMAKTLPLEEDIFKDNDEDKAHKSNVAKITFKTAREQLLGSNPAARRTLGTSRKAQARFVSPMLGTLDKSEQQDLPEVTDERLKHIDTKMIELIESEIIDKGTPIGWDDIAGLHMAKSVIQEAVVWPLLRPDIFTGLRRPPKGILLFGPPGTGKTLIGKCIAAQCNATFFSISASSLTSKWIGDGEKMVRALFAVARTHQPAVIFIDEIDSLLTQRSDSEHEATRRIKTEFLVQFDGAATVEDDRLLIVGATNRPQELDEAARRRLVKRLYIPLPDAEARKQIVENLLKSENNDLTQEHISKIAEMTEGYSGADMKSVCSEAAMGPIRSVPLSQIVSIQKNMVRPVCLQDFLTALQRVRPSVSEDDLGVYVKWNNTYGQGF